MSIDVETKDCTALSDAELADMADLCADTAIAHEIGTLSKESESWVLVTQAREKGKLKGFSYGFLIPIFFVTFLLQNQLLRGVTFGTVKK